jgi:aspartyl-tRNA(Asn)/glutamyl-tRNA(Gln) amidotransferase subunit C
MADDKKFVTEKDVDYIARLSRLKLTGDEKEEMGKDLEKIIGYINKLKELNTDNISPTSHVAPLKNVTREDKAKESLPVEEALKNAPERKEDYFKVPKIIE